MLFGLLSAGAKVGRPMTQDRIIRRYAGYYAGWCVAFGEHRVSYDESRQINWLYGDSRIGLILSPDMKRHFVKELLGKHDSLPSIELGRSEVRINQFRYPLDDEQDRQGFEQLRELFRGAQSPHMYLTSHFCYPKGTRIITFSSKKPPIIIYKEISPLKLVLD